jgi:hypothetical protein
MSKVYFQTLQRYLDWNVCGEGKDSGHYDEYHWHGPFWFQHEWCLQRFVSLPGDTGAKVRLIKHARSSFNAGKNMAANDKPFLSYFVPDLGVFSSFEGDFLPEDKMHQRQGYIMLKQIETYADRTMKKLTGSALAETRVFKTQEQLMVALCTRYDKYRKLFELEWPDLDGKYLADFIDRLTERRDKYTDPKAVERRERSKARELAKKTLGL